jgi:hypothetical protein
VTLLSIAPAQAWAQAQGDAPLSRILIDFLGASVRMASSTVTTTGNPHEAHYFPGFSQLATPFELNKSLVSQLSTFPLGSSSAGFVYRRDPVTGAVTPASQSFGPSFAERPLTVGRKKYNIGFSFQGTTYDSFEGQTLDDGSIKFYLQHNDCCPAPKPDQTNIADLTPFFEGDLIETAVALEIETDTTSFFANVGVTNNFDIGVAIPIVRVDLNASGVATIDRLSTADNPLIHSWDGLGQTVRVVDSVGGSASGIGDILLRAKYNFFQTDTAGLAAGLDLRLPTGDEDDLLGTGATQTKLLFIGALERDRWAPHVNLGYTFSSGTLSAEVRNIVIPQFGTTTNPPQTVLETLEPPDIDLSLPDEFNYVFGVDVAASSRVTVAVDVIGRLLRDVTRFDVTSSTYRFQTSTDPTIRSATRDALNVTETGNLNLALLAIGGKVNVARTLLISASVLIPVSDGGLKPRVTPVVGFDYVF